MASAILSGIGLNLVSSLIYDLGKKLCRVCHARWKCGERCHTLKSLLERMRPGVEVAEKRLVRLLQHHPEERSDYQGIVDWFDKLKRQLVAADEIVDKCLQSSGWNLCAALKKYSLSEELTALTKNIEGLESEVERNALLLHAMCIILFKYLKEKPNAYWQYPNPYPYPNPNPTHTGVQAAALQAGCKGFWEWVKEKDDILKREAETRGREANAVLHAWNTLDGSQQGYPVTASRLGYPANGPILAYPANGPQLAYPGPANGTQFGYPVIVSQPSDPATANKPLYLASARKPLYPTIASQQSYPAIASKSLYPEIASQHSYPESASKSLYPEIASQHSYPESASKSLYPEVASQHSYPASACQPRTELQDRVLFRHQYYGTVGPVLEDKYGEKVAEYKSAEDVKVPAAKPDASYVMEPKPHGENNKKEKWHDGVVEEEKKSRQPLKRLRDKVRRTFHSNKDS